MSLMSIISYIQAILFVVSSNTISNYVVDKDTDFPLPLDICMNINNHYIIYSCDESQNRLLKMNHTDNEYCNSGSPISTIFYDGSSSSQFNCNGETNYIIENYYESYTECSNANMSANSDQHTIFKQYTVTDVCYYDQALSKYAKASCNAFYSRTDYFDDIESCMDHYEEFNYYMYNNQTTEISLYSDLSSPSVCNPHSIYAEYPYHSLSRCVQQNITETYYDYHSNESFLSIPERIGWIDLYISITDYGRFLFDRNCTMIEKFVFENQWGWRPWNESWDLLEIAIDGEFQNHLCGTYTYSWYYKQFDIGITEVKGSIPETICLLSSHITGIQIYHAPLLTGSVPECIGTELIYLEGLLIVNTSLSGPIPPNIGNLWSFAQIRLEDNPLFVTTLPESVCNMGSYWDEIIVDNMPLLHGNIPGCFFNNNLYFSVLRIANTAINGTIPEEFCQNPNTTNMHLNLTNNPNMHGTIPECLSSPLLSLVGMTGLTGTVPQSIFCNSRMQQLQIENNPQLSPSTVPDCFSDPKLELEIFSIYNSSFVGTLPRLPFTPRIVLINVAHNDLEGTLSDIFSQEGYYYNETIRDDTRYECVSFKDDTYETDCYSYPGDTPILLPSIIMLQSNDFYEEDIGYLLRLWIENLNVLHISIADNPNIHGTIPEIYWNYTYGGTLWSEVYGIRTLFAHNCDISGTIPSDMNFTHLNSTTLHGNRLSGTIPTHISVADFNISFILLGNLFFTDEDNELPDWINSPFTTAPNLYVTQYDQYLSITVISVSSLGFIILISIILRNQMYRKLFRNSTEINRRHTLTDDEFHFFENIEFIKYKFVDYKLLLILIVIIMFYFFTESYFAMVTWEARFSLAWWYHEDDLEEHSAYHWEDWVLLSLALLLHVAIALIVLALHIDQILLTKIRKKTSLHLQEIEMKKQKSIPNKSPSPTSSPHPPMPQTPDLYGSELAPPIPDMELYPNPSPRSNNLAKPDLKPVPSTSASTGKSGQDKTPEEAKSTSKCCVIALYFALYIMGLSVVVIYLISTSLPDDNILGMNQNETIIITQSIGLILFINNRHIIRGLVNSIANTSEIVYHYRAEFVLFLRMLNIVILPLFASIFLLNDCGKYWSNFWNHCIDQEKKSKFDVFVDVGRVYFYHQRVQVLSSESICPPPTVLGMNPNRCIRSFLYHWSFVVMMKLIFSIFGSIFGVILRLIRKQCYPAKNELYIEGYYTSMVTNLIVSIMFLFANPLILPLNIMQISTRKFAYKICMKNFGMKLSTINKKDIPIHKMKHYLPVYFLWFGIALGQALVALFLMFCVNHQLLLIIFGAGCVIIDLYCFVRIRINKRIPLGLHGQKSADTDTVHSEHYGTEFPSTHYSPNFPPMHQPKMNAKGDSFHVDDQSRSENMVDVGMEIGVMRTVNKGGLHTIGSLVVDIESENSKNENTYKENADFMFDV